MSNKKNAKQEHTQKDGEQPKKPADEAEAAAQAQEPAADAAENAAGESAAEEKQVSETDVLKIYLEQSLGELKKMKAELGEQKKAAEAAKNETLQFKSKLESVVAEYENFRRRTVQEKENIFADAVAKSVTALLPALDNLERAVSFAETNPESFRHGVEMTLNQLNEGFKSLGVVEIEAKGKEFDPEKHNAVMHVEDETLSESVVADVFQKGYAIGDRVIRHSVVKVAN